MTGKVASFHSTSCQLDDSEGGGAGIGNVKSRMMPTYRKAYEELFSHTQTPKTVSIIGYVHLDHNVPQNTRKLVVNSSTSFDIHKELHFPMANHLLER